MTDLQPPREAGGMKRACPACYCVGRHSDDCPARPDAYYDLWLAENEKVRALEAELAELKARRCGECDSREGRSHYCLLWSINTPDRHSCADWTERREP